MKPGRKRGLAAILLQPVEHLHERVLRVLLGERIFADHAKDQPVHAGGVSVVESAGCQPVAGARAGDQIRIVHHTVPCGRMGFGSSACTGYDDASGGSVG